MQRGNVKWWSPWHKYLRWEAINTKQIERVLVAVDTETRKQSVAFSHLRNKCSYLRNKTFHSLENVSRWLQKCHRVDLGVKKLFSKRWICKYGSISKDGQLCVRKWSPQYYLAHLNILKTQLKKTMGRLDFSLVLHFKNLQIWGRAKQMYIMLFTKIHILTCFHTLTHLQLSPSPIFISLWFIPCYSASSKTKKSCCKLHTVPD